MPVLRKYPGRNEYYVVTSNKGAMVIFKLTVNGTKKLRSAGLAEGQNFDTSILLDLYRTGEAFTHGKATGEAKGKPRQMKFDFLNDAQPESALPHCSACGLVEDLHLVEMKAGVPTLSILCRRCRRKKLGLIDTSIPLPLVTRGILKRLVTMKKIGKSDSSVSGYQKVLEAKFGKKWEEIADRNKKVKATGQGSLLPKGQDAELF